ncbi:response regulator [Salana multivorans]
MSEVVRVLIIDDEALVRRALAFFVEEHEDMTVVGEAKDGVVGIQMCRALKPDVVLMDIQMPIMDGVEATRHIVAEHPEIRVLAVTAFTSEAHVVPALRAGASGYLLKDSEPGQIAAAIRHVYEGGAAIAPEVTRVLIDSVRRDARDPIGTGEALEVEALTDREREVVELLGGGLSNQEIADRLYLSEATVKTHLGRVMRKWGARDRTQVLITAVRAGIVQLV